jgi:hypothetical protein
MARLGASVVLVGLLITAGCAHGVDATGSEFVDSLDGPTASGEPGLPQSSVTHGAGDVDNVTPGSACASSSAGAAQLPISLVFMIDRSGSMGGDAIDAKWTAAVESLEDFFGSSSVSHIDASLTFFAQPDECNVDTYASPSVVMRSLPEPFAFSQVLRATQPAGETPTLPALQGAIAYAKTVKASLANPKQKVAIVLVTDGDPSSCGSTPENVAAEAAQAAKSDIKTYVVGVGSLANNLDIIAKGGGTWPHIQIDASSAAKTSSELRAAISKIKASALGCAYPLPKPPSGDALDVNEVNVDYTPAGETPKTLPYSRDCSNYGGWHYDDAINPSQIVMCPNACSMLQADTSGGHVDIVFGCVTKGDKPR